MTIFDKIKENKFRALIIGVVLLVILIGMVLYVIEYQTTAFILISSGLLVAFFAFMYYNGV